VLGVVHPRPEQTGILVIAQVIVLVAILDKLYPNLMAYVSPDVPA
jgi:hypothetical protein